MFLLHHYTFQNIRVWYPLWPHSDTFSYLPPFTGCMRTGGAESIFLSSCFSRAGPQVAPHAYSAPQLSGIQDNSLSAWRELSLINLTFFSLKGKSIHKEPGSLIPLLTQVQNPAKPRLEEQAGGQALLPQDTRSCQGLCWNTQGPAG